MAINIVCCLWGDWPAKDWGEEYVRRLYNGVSRHLSIPFNFICFTDRPNRMKGESYEVRLLDSPSWIGCLPKLFVHSPRAGLTGRTLLFDLDNVITGPLEPMAEYNGPFAVRASFGSYPHKKVPDGDMIGFEAGVLSSKLLWENFSRNVSGAETRTGGRERWFIQENLSPDLWQDILGPEFILSYKRHLRGKKTLPKSTSIVSFHDRGVVNGTSRPHQLPDAWIKDHWK